MAQERPIGGNSPGSVRLDPDDLLRAQVLLSSIPNGYRRAMVRSIDRTLITARKLATKRIREEINLKATDVKAAIKVRKARYATLEGELGVKGKHIPLVKYGARQVKRGVSIQVLKRNSRKISTAIFMAQMKSGHFGVYWRKKDAAGQLVPRLPIKQRFGPSIPEVYSGRPIGQVMPEAAETFAKNFAHEVSYLLR
ncbi:MAG: phage tail protein [Desulfocurvibacter africanus]